MNNQIEIYKNKIKIVIAVMILFLILYFLLPNAMSFSQNTPQVRHGYKYFGIM